MIIREGSPLIAIPQAAHAELTAQLARNLNYASVRLSYPPEIWFQAVARHDDGWLLWDRKPETNPDTGIWYNFMKMPAATHLYIWKRAVESSEGLHPAVTWWISRHVVRLLDYHDWSAEGYYVQNQATKFKKEQQLLQNRLLSNVKQIPQYDALDELLAQCDWLSLVLCMGHQQGEVLPMFAENDTTPEIEIKGEDIRVKNVSIFSGDFQCKVEAFKIPGESANSLHECDPVTLCWNVIS